MHLGPRIIGWRRLLCGAMAVLLLPACAPRPPTVEQIKARGALRVVSLNGPTTWYQGAHGPQGLQYHLASAFAASLGTSLTMYTVADVAALRRELSSGRADIVAAAITPDFAWQRVALASDSYERVAQLVVFRRGTRKPDNIAALRDARLVIGADSPQVGVLAQLRRNGTPWLRWAEVAHDADDPLAQVAAGRAEFAIVDADHFAYARQLYPQVNVGFTLPDTRAAHWMMGRGADSLAAAVNGFLAGLRGDPRLAELLRADAPDFHYQTAMGFQSDIEERLPQLQAWFEEAAARNGVDWRLLAAIGYHESRWVHDAASRDGARGVMMLTLDTANEMGISDRNDPYQSIVAGARYFAQTRAKIPARIPEPDRSWMTIAAYNVGFGHLEDARILAQSRGRNPDSWQDVSEALPLLAQERWYLKARHGYARGWEPVRQVERVQYYLNVLEWFGSGRADPAPAPRPQTRGAAG